MELHSVGVPVCCRQVCLDLCGLCVLCRCVCVHQRLDCGSVTLCRGQGAGAVCPKPELVHWGSVSILRGQGAMVTGETRLHAWLSMLSEHTQCMDVCAGDTCPCTQMCVLWARVNVHGYMWACFCVHQCVLWPCV